MESDARFYKRRASEEMAAAGRAVTEAARQRRIILAEAFLARLKTLDDGSGITFGSEESPAFGWSARGKIDA
ncbi:MAG TPA: hypothetical protein VNB78_00225 [Sphingomicrobium sp.]|jgi:hypothetical protein|nr:hypothetical protein [Sphingomicrobium sp.]